MGMLGKNHSHRFMVSHVPQSNHTVSSSATDQGHVVIRCKTVNGLIERLFPCSVRTGNNDMNIISLHNPKMPNLQTNIYLTQLPVRVSQSLVHESYPHDKRVDCVSHETSNIPAPRFKLLPKESLTVPVSKSII